MTANILLFSTSTRVGSYNATTVKLIASLIKEAKADLISLSDYSMPIYNADDEINSGFPKNAQNLHKVFTKADGIIISTAEYNSSYPPLVKNAIDWLSRVDRQCFYNKPVLIVSASPSEFGGINASFMLKHLFMSLGSIVVPSKFCIVLAHNSFDEKGNLKNHDLNSKLLQLLDTFMLVMNALKA